MTRLSGKLQLRKHLALRTYDEHAVFEQLINGAVGRERRCSVTHDTGAWRQGKFPLEPGSRIDGIQGPLRGNHVQRAVWSADRALVEPTYAIQLPLDGSSEIQGQQFAREFPRVDDVIGAGAEKVGRALRPGRERPPDVAAHVAGDDVLVPAEDEFVIAQQQGCERNGPGACTSNSRRRQVSCPSNLLSATRWVSQVV